MTNVRWSVRRRPLLALPAMGLDERMYAQLDRPRAAALRRTPSDPTYKPQQPDPSTATRSTSAVACPATTHILASTVCMIAKRSASWGLGGGRTIPGSKWIFPGHRGVQILMEKGARTQAQKGLPIDPTRMHHGHYLKVSYGGRITRVPLRGNRGK